MTTIKPAWIKGVKYIGAALVIVEIIAFFINSAYYETRFKEYVSSIDTSFCQGEDMELTMEDWYCPHCYYKSNHTEAFNPHDGYVQPEPLIMQPSTMLINLWRNNT